MISITEAEEIHQILINTFGGSQGIWDLNALNSALARPFQIFGDKELYSTPTYKAAALIESIVVNHPFVDGNKRTGYVLMRLFLMSKGFDIEATQDEKYNFVISIASGNLKFDEIVQGLKNHIRTPLNLP